MKKRIQFGQPVLSLYFNFLYKKHKYIRVLNLSNLSFKLVLNTVWQKIFLDASSVANYCNVPIETGIYGLFLWTSRGVMKNRPILQIS
jgi:hypothetical protein